MPQHSPSLSLADSRRLIAAGETNHEKVVIFAGGVPVKAGDVVVGAFGASGGTVDQDTKVAEAAVSAFSSNR